MSIKINKTESVTNRLGFKPFKKYNNLCLGYLVGVEVTTSEIDGESAWEYAGKSVPRLAFHFEAFKESKSDPDRFFTKAEMMIASVNNKGEAITDDNLEGMYRELWKRIRHLFEQYTKEDNFKEMEFEVEFEPNDPIDKRIADMTKFFNNVMKSFTKGKDKKTPIYGEKSLLGMKLIKSARTSKKGKTYMTLDLSNYVGKGQYDRVSIKGDKITTVLEFSGSESVDLTTPMNMTQIQDGVVPSTDDMPAGVAESLGL